MSRPNTGWRKGGPEAPAKNSSEDMSQQNPGVIGLFDKYVIKNVTIRMLKKIYGGIQHET